MSFNQAGNQAGNPAGQSGRNILQGGLPGLAEAERARLFRRP
ncbi:hypothetical protein [Alteraurantiacibacter palmitatis]|uniref:Uncharacterized protein n=1 Tax=Alteraurantiacibacter palmitatis TaxID=2054628 RepID=A0ABV7E7D1_9SPHN